jgi:hypothetical protein
MGSYTIDQFLQLETKVWDGFVSGNAEVDARLLADEFLGVYSSGFASKADHLDQLQGGPIVAWYELSEARIRVLAEGVVLLAYRAESAWYKDGEAGDQESMYVTSIWQTFDGVWKNVFSQDTPVVK